MRNSYLVCSLRACHMWLTRNHIFIREIWGKFTSFIFWNFEISLVSLGRFQNFKKVNSVNLSQVSLLNMWLLVQILQNLKYTVFIEHFWWRLLPQYQKEEHKLFEVDLISITLLKNKFLNTGVNILNFFVFVFTFHVIPSIISTQVWERYIIVWSFEINFIT